MLELGRRYSRPWWSEAKFKSLDSKACIAALIEIQWRGLRLGCIILAFILVATGCAHFQPRPLAPGDTAANWERRSLDNPALREFLQKSLGRPMSPWPIPSWDFETLFLAALYYHPSLEVARAQWQVALGGNITAAARPNPTLTVSPGYDFTATSLGMNPWIPAVSFDVPIETAGKRGYRKAQAQHLSDSARLNLAAMGWQVRSNLRASLLDFTAARQRELLLEKQDASQERIVRSLEQRLQAGAVAGTELTLVRMGLEKSRLELTETRRLAAEARVRVAEAIGLPVRALEGIDLEYRLSEPRKIPDELMSTRVRDLALQGRADILGALAEYAASQSALQLEIARQYPDVHFGPSYQFNQGDHQFSLVATAELPILNQNQGPIAEAEARRAEAAARFIALQAKVIAEIDRAVAAYRVTEENLLLLESLASTQQKQTEAIAAQVQAGAADPLDLLNSQLELGVSGLALLDGRVKAREASGALEDAMQRPIKAMESALLEPRRPPATKEKTP